MKKQKERCILNSAPFAIELSEYRYGLRFIRHPALHSLAFWLCGSVFRGRDLHFSGMQGRCMHSKAKRQLYRLPYRSWYPQHTLRTTLWGSLWKIRLITYSQISQIPAMAAAVRKEKTVPRGSSRWVKVFSGLMSRKSRSPPKAVTVPLRVWQNLS